MTTRTAPLTPWDTMSGNQKTATLGKLVIAVLTFGFVFPRAMDPWLREHG